MAPKAGVSHSATTKRKGVPSEKQHGDSRAKKAKIVEEEIESDSESGEDLAEMPSRLKADYESKKLRDNGEASASNGQNSRENHLKQKQLAQERKAAKPLADEVARAKKLWERLRRKSHVPKEERLQLVDELYGIITGRVKDFVLKHDAVRAVQTAIKYSTPAQRKQIAKELVGTYAQLAESRYAKFLIGKLLVQNDDEIRDLIVPEFYGKVRKLINHSEASWILDDVYRGVATKEQKARLLREWYGPEFAIFQQTGEGEVTADLSKIFAAEPSKRAVVMRYLFDMANNLIQKKLTGFTILHDAMLQYFLNLKPESEELKEFVEVIKGDEAGDLLKNMAFTKSGARLVCLLLANGGAKDRKQILKTYKDTFQLMAADQHAHMIILAAYDTIDDTVLVSKTIFPEILGKSEGTDAEIVVFLANDLNARITICYLFEGMTRSLFPASHAADLEILKEIHEIRQTTSKKDAEIRRKELVGGMSLQLLAAVAAAPKELVATSFGCQFATDVLLSAVGDKKSALEAIASTAGGDPTPVVQDDMPFTPLPHISLTPFGGKMFKTLIAGGRFDKEAGAVKRVDPPLDFADILYPVIKEHAVQWAVGPSSFTIVGLLEAPDFSFKKELLDTLKASKKVLQKAATEETAYQQARDEAAKAKEEAAKAKGEKAKKGKKAPKQDVPKSKGNQGTKLILDMLKKA
ncbi:armadillo-type protein [Cercophora scortea]|uniref:Armadillo-type protein n=1 Tax=Cercophora scortea TaxID=314031 RepID=A0AAE0J699_9PEZI|nr:armadillo-type protein [Cercophora scortea]